MSEEIKKKIQSGQYKRSALYADSEREMFMHEARKNSLTRFFVLINKYNIEPDDIDELLEISQFLI